MLVYLVQHAEAKSKEEDPERGLSEKGFKDIEKVANFAKKMGVKVQQIFHSGKKRAFQTAEVLAKYLEPPKGIISAEGLAPLDDPNLWFERLNQVNEDIMLVGHLPHLAKLASLLLCGDAEKGLVEFQMGGIVCLRKKEDRSWSLKWMIIPEII